MNQDDLVRRALVCPYCFSPDIVEKTLVGGPMAHLDNDDGTYKCLQCGRTAVPLDFANWDEYREFIEKKEEKDNKFFCYPMMPLVWSDDHPIGSARPDEPLVVNVIWDDGLMKGELEMAFSEYWNIATEKVYGTKDACILDVSGIVRSRSEVIGLQKLMRRRNQVILDIGIRDVQDVYDSFTMGAAEVLASTWTMSSIDDFKEMFELSDRCVPCICYDGKVYWGRRRGNPSDLTEVLRRLKGIGFERVAIMDVTRLGTDDGPNERMLMASLELGFDVLIGGGVSKNHIDYLAALGASGALLEPFSPEIRASMKPAKDLFTLPY